MHGAPAAKAGLVAGDTIVGADGQTLRRRGTRPPRTSAPTPTRPSSSRTSPAGGRRRAKTVRRSRWSRTRRRPGAATSACAPASLRERPGPVEAVTLGLTGFKDVVVGTFTGFWWLLSGKISATGPDGAVGPVGIIDVSRQAVQQSWYPILLAFLSFNLGLINLLPILPFDGGHIAMNVVEKIRGRRLDTRVFERMVAFGTVLLVMLFIFLTFNDVKRLVRRLIGTPDRERRRPWCRRIGAWTD